MREQVRIVQNCTATLHIKLKQTPQNKQYTKQTYKNQHINNIRQLIRQSGYKNEYDIIPLPISGSNRLYFRAINRSKQKDTIIASFNEDVNENIAHYSFTNHFMNMGISVPEIIARDDSYKYFLVQDLGKTALFDLNRHKPKEAIEYYIKVVSDLVEIQVEGIKNIDSIQTGELCKEAMFFAKDILKNNGYFISKIFMGGTFNEIVAEGKKYFKEVKVFKPKSSRKDSKESFIICSKLRQGL